MKKVVCLLLMAVCIIVPSWGSKAKPKVGLSLSGGAALGYAHIGFLQAMDEAGVKPDVICGSSMGALVGMMYCSGYTPQQILQVIKDSKLDRLSNIWRPRLSSVGGMANYDWLRKLLSELVPHNSFDKLNPKFYCCVTDLNHIKAQYIGTGEMLREYVTASASMPLLFAPVQVGDVYFVDGGVIDNFPSKPLIDEKCDVRIGVVVLQDTVSEKIDNPHKLWLRAYSICSYSNIYGNFDDFTHLLAISPRQYWLSDFKAVDELYRIGYEEGKRFFKVGKWGKPHVKGKKE